MNTNTTKTITLDTPLQRGTQTITEIAVRKPAAGELRGLSLTDLIRIETGALIEALPRVTTPPLSKHEVMALDPSDLLQLGTVLATFCLPKLRDEETAQEVTD